MGSIRNKKSLNRFKNSLGIDLGHYPLTPWQNERFKEKTNIGDVS